MRLFIIVYTIWHCSTSECICRMISDILSITSGYVYVVQVPPPALCHAFAHDFRFLLLVSRGKVSDVIGSIPPFYTCNLLCINYIPTICCRDQAIPRWQSYMGKSIPVDYTCNSMYLFHEPSLLLITIGLGICLGTMARLFDGGSFVRAAV